MGLRVLLRIRQSFNNSHNCSIANVNACPAKSTTVLFVLFLITLSGLDSFHRFVVVGQEKSSETECFEDLQIPLYSVMSIGNRGWEVIFRSRQDYHCQVRLRIRSVDKWFNKVKDFNSSYAVPYLKGSL